MCWLEACWCYVAGLAVGDVVSECRPNHYAPSSRKLLKMDVLTSETCWAVNWHNKASVIKLVYLYSNLLLILVFRSYFFIFFWFNFLSMTICSMICTFLFNFVKYVFCIVTFVYSYCYVCVFLLLFMWCSVYSGSLCCSMNCLCVNGYCTTATVCLPNCS